MTLEMSLRKHLRKPSSSRLRGRLPMEGVISPAGTAFRGAEIGKSVV